MTASSKENQSPRSPERLESQRNRILDAAEDCFIRYGFHAASMASIAETAGISQGLAYRYFKNKSAIIRAIIERQLSQRHSLADGAEDAGVFAKRIIELVRAWASAEDGKLNPVLFLEMCSESSRDPEVAAALAEADTLYLEDFSKWITKLAAERGKTVSKREIETRFHALQALVEGSALLASRKREVDRVARNEMIVHFLNQTLSFD